ncbi:interleukin-23 receptor [Menidia menidia]
MNVSSTLWKCIITTITFFFRGCPLLPALCERFIHLGNVMVEPAPPLLLGSDLTVYCQINQCRQGHKLSLELNWKDVKGSKRINCTTAVFYPRVLEPQSSVVCKMGSKFMSTQRIVNGMTLQAGLPPDKPGNITCETTRSSEVIRCSWPRGKETYLRDSYNISVSRQNGTQLHVMHIQNAEEITLPRAIFDQNTKHLLTITKYNHFGTSQSDPFILCVTDIVIPETPLIVKMEFGNDSASAILHWKTSESSGLLRAQVRLRSHDAPWEAMEGSEVHEGQIQVDNLQPLTEYELQLRTCAAASWVKQTEAPGFTTSPRMLCSHWSPSVREKTPAKRPSQQLHVWRTMGDKNQMRLVTVLWKPLPRGDYSGEVRHYKILVTGGHEETCAAPSSMCCVQVPAGVQALSVWAVTSYGASPPATVELRNSGGLRPILREVVPAVDGDAAHVSWSPSTHKEMVYYIIEWASVPATQLWWKRVEKDQNGTSVTGLSAGVRYNVSLYAVTTRGVSAPASHLLYSREQKPASGPSVCVLAHEVGHILITWDELPIDKRRGFITKYTIYLQSLGSSTELNVSASGTRQMLLKSPNGHLAIQMTASNSAGEGPPGSRVSSWPEAHGGTFPAVGEGIVVAIVIFIFTVFVVNLLRCSCVRERIKQKCIARGPAWLVGNVPKPGQSNAIKLLKEDRNQPSFSSTYSDPPLSRIIMISQEEKDEVYPILHVEVSEIRSEDPTGEHLLSSTSRRMLYDAGYKPQTATPVLLDEEEAEEEAQEDASDEEDAGSSALDGLLGGLLSSVNVDFSDSSRGLNLGSLFWSKTAETRVMNKVLLRERRETEDSVGAEPPCLLEQDGKNAPEADDFCSPRCGFEATQSGGYFPQIASFRAPTPDNQR